MLSNIYNRSQRVTLICITMYNYDIAKTFFCCKTVYVIDIHDVNNLQILRTYFKALTEIIENLKLCVFLNTYRAILSCFKWFLPPSV